MESQDMERKVQVRCRRQLEDDLGHLDLEKLEHVRVRFDS